MIRYLKFCFLKAHELIWKLGHWKCLLAPLGLSVLLAIVLAGLSILLASWGGGWLHGYLSSHFEMAEWLKHVWFVLLVILCIGPCYVAFRSLVMVCYGPWLDRLSVQAEILVNGHAKEAERTILESIKRPLHMAFLTISASIGVLIAGLVLGLVPIVGALFSFGFVAFFQIFLSAIGYLDPYLDRTGHSPKASFALMRKNKFGVFCFGLIGLIVTMVPFIGWFLGPTYCVVAGVVYGILLNNTDQA